MTPTPAEPAACFDLKLLAFIKRQGGRVSVRRLTRGPGACRPASAARAKLEALVRAGFGEWTHSQPGARGGRPSRLFRLTMPAETLHGLLNLARGTAQAQGPGWMRLIQQEVMAFLNRPLYRATTCAQLAQALRGLAGTLEGLGRGEPDIPAFKREMRLDRRGRAGACWTYSSPRCGVRI